jgi:hypothetical protein
MGALRSLLAKNCTTALPKFKAAFTSPAKTASGKQGLRRPAKVSLARFSCAVATGAIARIDDHGAAAV